MQEYAHIDSIYKRSPDTNRFILGQFSKPEFEFLKDLPWVGTEKVDGMNIRVMWKGGEVSFGGKSDRANIPGNLVKHLLATYTTERMTEAFGAEDICLYGEGFGAGIQKAGKFYGPNQSFVLFDAKVGEWWLQRSSLEDIAEKLSIPIVPILYTGPLMAAVDIIADGVQSTWGEFPAEGLVLKPAIDLADRAGRRIIVKVKTKDFQ